MYFSFSLSVHRSTVTENRCALSRFSCAAMLQAIPFLFGNIVGIAFSKKFVIYKSNSK
jgi:hypothetical protein